MEDSTNPRERIAEDDGQLRAWIVLALTILALAIVYRLAQPFLPAFAWGLVLTLLFLPLHLRLEARTGSPGIAAGLSAALAALFVTLPALAVAEYLVRELAAGVAALEARLATGEWMKMLEGSALLKWLERIDLSQAASAAMESATGASAAMARASTGYLLTFLISFYLTFYLLRDRDEAWRLALDLSPLPRGETARLLREAADAIHATVFGTITVAAVQGLLGALIFWWLGLPNPFLWGAIMGALAIVPVLGAFVIWAPAALFLGLGGEWGKAALLAAWGVGVIGVADNLLYPILVGNRLRMHTVPTFVAIVGGVLLFGASGIVIGPLVMTAAIFLLRHWGARIPESEAPKET